MNSREEKKSKLLTQTTCGDIAYEHTEQMTDDLDIEYAIAKKPDIWRRAEQVETPVKKKIIISDWSHRFKLYENEDAGDLNAGADLEKWRYLLAKDYELYVWTGQATPIKNVSELEEALARVVPIESHELRKQLGEKGFESDEVFIADFNKSRELTETCNSLFPLLNESQKRILRVLPISKLSELNEVEITKIIGAISDEPKVNILIDNFSEAQALLRREDIKRLMCKHHLIINSDLLPGYEIAEYLKTLPAVRSLELTGDLYQTDTNLIISACTQLKSLTYEHTALAPTKLPPELESMTVKGDNLSIEEACAVIESQTMLKKLDVQVGKDMPEKDYVSYPNSFNTIEELNVSVSDQISPAIKLGSLCPQLRSLHIKKQSVKPIEITNDSKIGQTITPIDIKWEPINEITDVMKINSDISKFKDYLKLNSNDYRNEFKSESLFDMTNNSIPSDKSSNEETFTAKTTPPKSIPDTKLEELHIDNVGIMFSLLAIYLEHSPSLVSLKLTNLSVKSKHFGYMQQAELEGKLNQLEELDCSGSKIHSETFANIIRASTNLKSLNLNDCNIALEICFKDLYCPSLQELSLCSSCYFGNSETIQAARKAFPNITYLALSFGKEDDDATINQLKQWKQISELKVENVTEDQLRKIIVAVPTLKYINHPNTINLDQLAKEFPHIVFARSNEEKYDISTKMQAKNNQVPAQRDRVYLKSKTTPAETLSANRIFHLKDNGMPAPNHYRSNVFCNIESNGFKLEVFNAEETYRTVEVQHQTKNDIQRQYFQHESNSVDVYLGELQVPRSNKHGELIRLPGLSPNDKLLSINIDPPQSFKVSQCIETSCYHVELTAPTNVRPVITYRLQSDIERYPEAHPDELAEIQDEFERLLQNPGMIFDVNSNLHTQTLLKFFRNFAENAALYGIHNSPDELLRAIVTQQKGLCEHRAIAFMEAAKIHGITARYDENPLHAFVEIYDSVTNKWRIADLGGGHSEIIIHDLPSQTKQTAKTAAAEATAVEPIVADKETQPPSPPQEMTADNPFNTWDNVTSTAKSSSEYCAELLEQAALLQSATTKKNVLCTIDSRQAEELHSSLAKLVTQRGNTCYTIANIDDIDPTATKIDKTTGEACCTDSGLMTFLKTAKSGDVLLVDWSKYKAKHVGLNTMIDADHRKLLGVEIPDGVTIVSMLNKNQHMREDFYSRFSFKSRMPETLTVNQVTPAAVNSLTESQSSQICIDFHDNNWRNALLGQFKILGDNKYTFEESDFIKGLRAKNSEFVFRNAPWHLAEFRAFMTDVMTTGKIEANGETIQFDTTPIITNYKLPYPLNVGKYDISTDVNLASRQAHVINSQTINRVHTTYICNQQGNFDEQPGIFANNKNKLVELLVTEPLTNAQWSKLLNAAHENQVSLEIYAVKQAFIPQEMSQHAGVITSISSPRETIDRVTVTTDMEFAHVFDQAHLNSNQACISISEKTTYTDLIEAVKKVKQDDGTYTYQYQTSALAALLLDGQSVILKGNMSPQLARQLESLFCQDPYLVLNGKRQDIKPEQLTLITSEKPPFNLVGSNEVKVTDSMRWKLIEKLGYPQADIEKLSTICKAFCDETKLPEFSFIQLRTMLEHMKANPISNPIKPLLRLRKDYRVLAPIAQRLWGYDKSKKIHENDPMQNRSRKIEDVLATSPYVFVAGSSGIGKSKFMHDEMKKGGWKVHEGVDNLAAIMHEAETTGEKTLVFIDEANFGNSRTFSMLENLFNKPETLIIDGQLKRPPPNLKFAFAGNFGYFKGRQQHDLFADHGAVITFKELPDTYLVEKVITPTLNQVYQGDEHNKICYMLLQCYHHINKLMPDTHPFTARNLHTMAMRIAHYPDNLSMTQRACMSAYDEASGLLNKQEREQFAKFLEKEFKIESVSATKSNLKAKTKTDHRSQSHSKFKMSARRVNPVRLMGQSFKTREMKIKNPTLATQGTAGLLIEGESGIGKSLMAVAYLEAMGYRDGNAVDAKHSNNADHAKTYYYINSVDRDEIIKQLHKAFHEGTVVIIEELNTLDLEEVLNKFMSGRDLKGNLAERPGFFVIGTQNPVSYDNRKKLTPAFANRFDKMNLKEYQRDDLIEFTKNPVLVDQFMAASAYAKTHHLEPAPTPRDLFKK